jgi:two-component system sensor histidine kinase RegB
MVAPLADRQGPMHYCLMNQQLSKARDDSTRRNYYRLFMLRNAEILLIGLGIAAATLVFRIPLSLRPLLVILALLVVLNLYTLLRLRTERLFSDTELFVQMLLDVAGLTGIFFYAGGASNPFIWFYLLPLMIAATILPRVYTWIMAAVTVLCYTALFLIDTSAHAEHALHDTGFRMHLLGMWLGFVMSAGFVAVIIVGMAHSLRERDRRLAEAREQALQNERLVALGTLAAGTAHELGTPLGTMAILTAELENEYADSGTGDLAKKLGILKQQIGRCKEALSELSTAAGADRAESGRPVPVMTYLGEVITEWQTQRPDAGLLTDIPSSMPDRSIIAERTLTQALINILDNAADASPGKVSLHADCTGDSLTIGIGDRGPGLSDEIQSQLGRQPVTTKREGLGVGLYLAHATIHRLGGTLAIRNREHGGTLLTITLPLLPDEY